MTELKRLTPEERGELVAFLDGELDPETTRLLETKIALSASARREVDVLKQTWDLLEFLDMPAPSSEFTQRTVQMLTVEAKRQSAAVRTAESAARTTALVALWIAGVAGAGLLSFAVVAYWPDPNRQLLEDLPVLERFDEYRAVQDIQFLRMVREMKLLEDIDETPGYDEISPDVTNITQP